jgi:hypothetical protein
VIIPKDTARFDRDKMVHNMLLEPQPRVSFDEEIAAKWLSVFASNVPDEIMNNHIRKIGNHMWHIFTWGSVPCSLGDEARKLLDSQSFSVGIIFQGGYSSTESGFDIEDVKICGKTTSVDLDGFNDVYLVDKDFQWTYVKTHDSTCGPYFCFRAN